jgi:hypothetical protein
VVKVLSSLNGREKQMIRIKFLNLARENLNTHHVVTYRVTHAIFPFLSGLWIRVTPLEYRGPRTSEQSRAVAALALTICPWERSQEVEDKVHSPDQAGTKAYRLPYSRHVVSTFKNITTTTTHRDLSVFAKHTGPQ